jgi:hypothetical protein
VGCDDSVGGVEAPDGSEDSVGGGRGLGECAHGVDEVGRPAGSGARPGEVGSLAGPVTSPGRKRRNRKHLLRW